MRKLKLEALQVESFATEAASSLMRGTVQGRGTPAPGTTTATLDTNVTDCAICYPSATVPVCPPPTAYTCVQSQVVGCASPNCSLGTGCYPHCWDEAPSPSCPIGP